MATIETRIRQIENEFKIHKDILDSSEKIEPRKSIGKDVNIIWIPSVVDHDNPRDGLALKGEAGYLSIKEELDQNGQVLGYLYRFTSDQYTYTCSAKDGESRSDVIFFNFHYQEDDEHEPHVSFLHPSIKYISHKITLGQFLDFVGRIFFSNGEKRDFLPWNSRI